MATESKSKFQSELTAYKAKQIASAIGCSVPTAYDWKSGRRSPPAWQQDGYLQIIKNKFGTGS